MSDDTSKGFTYPAINIAPKGVDLVMPPGGGMDGAYQSVIAAMQERLDAAAAANAALQERNEALRRGQDLVAGLLEDARKGTPAVALEAKRATAFLDMLIEALKKARSVGGANAKMHVGDVLELAERFQGGGMDAKLDDLPPVAGPFYPRDRQ